MHILIAVLHRSTQPTGVCRHAANLARCLASRQEVSRITLVTGAWQRGYFDVSFGITSCKIQVVGIDIRNSSIARNLWFISALPRLARELKPDIVHLAFPLPFVRSRFPCAVVSTVHDLYAFDYPENFGRAQAVFNRLFFKRCITQSDGLICVSRETLGRLENIFPAAAVRTRPRVIYNYVDFDEVRALPPAIFVEQPSRPFLLTVAQHRKNKNLDLLVAAYARLLNDQQIDHKMTLVIVGSDGPETEYLKACIARSGLESRVYLLFSISDSELCWLYKHCALFAICSSIEGFCIPLVEALSIGCNIVCSDIPIFREVAVSDCRYFDLSGDATSHVARAIGEALSSGKPVSTVNGRFDLATAASQHVEFYRDVLSRGAGGLGVGI